MTFIIKAIQKSQALRRIHSYLLSKGQVMLNTLLAGPGKCPGGGGVNAERPRYEIRQEQIHELRRALGFRWVDIARMLGMSPRTRSRQRQEFGMPLGQQHKFSSWFDTWTIL